jgi:hypothetical protein
MERLDDRAARAATSLRETVAAGLDDDELPRLASARRRRWQAAVAAVVVLIAGAGVVLTIGGDDDGQPVVAGPGEGATGEPLPRLIADPVPEGMRVDHADDRSVAELRGGAMADVGGVVSMYGDPHVQDPFAERDAVVMVVAAPEGSTEAVEDHVSLGTPVTVRGQEGQYGDGSDGRPPWIAWMEDDRVAVELSSHSLSRDELVEVAGALELSDPDVPPGETLPGGFALVASTPTQALIGTSDSASISYSGDSAGIFLHVVRASEGFLAYARWAQTGQGEDVVVRGRDATLWLSEHPAGEDDELVQQASMIWLERPDVVVSLNAWGIPPSRLLAVAESLRPATDEEWEALQRAATEPPEEAIASGEDGDVKWYVTIDTESRGGPTMCVNADGPSSGTGSCVGFPNDGRPYPADGIESSSTTLTDIGGHGGVVFGRVSGDTAEVRVHGPTGGTEVATLHAVDGELYFVAFWPALERVEVMTYGTDGTELHRTAVEILPAPDAPGFPRSEGPPDGAVEFWDESEVIVGPPPVPPESDPGS